MHDETHTHSVAEDDTTGEPVSSHSPAFQISQIVYYLGGLVALLLAIRFVFIFFGAANAGIASFIYQITNPLVAPFYGIFRSSAVFGTARIEIESLFAIIAVALISYLIVGLIRLLR